MIHNGIEHGVMSSLCEAWEIMDKCLKMTGDEIGDVFDSWCEKGELVTSSYPSVVLSAEPEALSMAALSCTKSEMPLSKMPTIPKAPEFGPISKLLPLTFLHRV
ncbi:hypothetical protein LB505_008935 [Fusarium chuoi]|nr:hypothetical protein LB505_008935 [Fusarium chuoi]